jgi:hypothetical protein
VLFDCFEMPNYLIRYALFLKFKKTFFFAALCIYKENLYFTQRRGEAMYFFIYPGYQFSPHPPSAPSPQGEGPSILSSFMPLTISASLLVLRF